MITIYVRYAHYSVMPLNSKKIFLERVPSPGKENGCVPLHYCRHEEGYVGGEPRPVVVLRRRLAGDGSFQNTSQGQGLGYLLNKLNKN